MTFLSTPLALTRDINGYVAFGLVPSYQGVYGVLAANTLVTITVPTGPADKYLAIFSYYNGSDVWIQFDTLTTLSLPTSTFTATTAENNPSQREVIAGQSIQLISVSANGGVGIKYYAIQ